MTATQTLTLADAAERLGIHRSTARRWAKEGRELAPGVRAFRVCAYWKVAREPLEQLLSGSPPVALVASATAALHPPMRGEAGATSGAGGGRAADNCITSGVVAEPPLKTTPPTGPSRAGVTG